MFSCLLHVLIAVTVYACVRAAFRRKPPQRADRIITRAPVSREQAQANHDAWVDHIASIHDLRGPSLFESPEQFERRTRVRPPKIVHPTWTEFEASLWI